LEPSGSKPAESVAREVLKAPVALREDVVKQIVAKSPKDADGEATATAAEAAKAVEAVVSAAKAKAAPKPAKQPKAAPVPADPPMDGGTVPAAVDGSAREADSVGVPLPDRLAAAFAKCSDFDAFANAMKVARAHLNRIIPDPDAALSVTPTGTEHVNGQEIVREFGNAVKAAKFARPFAVCPYCKGKGCKRGDGCRGLGWLTEASYKAVPNDLKAAMKGEAA
jgi:hypothetical protein